MLSWDEKAGIDLKKLHKVSIDCLFFFYSMSKIYHNQKDYKDLDPNYLFANLGFNLRPTELNGGFGLEQIKKIVMYYWGLV